jgi:hypothetical protein
VPTGTTPFVPFTGVIVNTDPLQITEDMGVIAGEGFTVKVNVWSGPLHD